MPVEDDAVGTDHLLKIHEAIKTIREHHAFADIDTAEPLTIGQGGQQQSFDKDMAAKALSGVTHSHKCGCNLFWSDLLWMANHRVPINFGQIRAIQKELPYDKPPIVFPFEVTVAVENKSQAAHRPDSGWPRLSPPEPVHAMLLSMQEAIQNHVSDGCLKDWRRLCLTVPFSFEMVAVGEPRFWRAQNLREQAVQHGLVVQMSLRQRIFDVAGFKLAKEKATGQDFSAEKVAKLYAQHLKLASNSEAISNSFVEDALAIHKRVLSLDPCQKCLEWADRELLNNNPWKSIYSLKAMLDRASTADNVIWAMQGLLDGFRVGFLDSSTFAVNRIKDPRASYVEVLKMKRDLKNHLLDEWLENTLELDAKWKATLRGVFGAFDSVRSKYAPYPDGKEADSAWLLGAPESVVSTAEFLEQVLYLDTFDTRYRDAVKSKHEVDDFLGYSTIAAKLSELEKMARADKKPKPAASADVAEEKAAAPAAESSEPAAASADQEGNGPESTMGKLSDDDRQLWRQQMLKTIRTHVRFLAEPKTQADLEQQLRDCGYACLKGDPTGQVLLHFDLKKFGEPLTRPDLRTPTLRDGQYNKLVRAVLNARTGPDEPAALHNGDVALLLDGGKSGNKTKLLQPWREGTSKESNKKAEAEAEDDEEAEEDEPDDDKPNFVVDRLMVAYTEESLAARKQRVRGTGTLKQLETCWLVTSKKLNLPTRPRKHFEGSSTGDLLSGVALPSLASEWKVPWQLKKEILGKKNLVAVGGKTKYGSEEPKMSNRSSNGEEPLCYWSMPLNWYEELIHQYYGKLVIDITPGDGRFAWASLLTRTGYVGICYTQEHVEALEKRIFELLEAEMIDSKSPLFNHAYCVAVGKSAASAEAKPKDKPKPKDKTSKPKDKSKPTKPKPKDKQKKTKKNKGDDKDQDEDPDNEDVVVQVEDDDEEEKPEEENDDMWDPLEE